jgi:hypothetical protein
MPMNYSTGFLSLDLLVGGALSAGLVLLLIFIIVDHLNLAAGAETGALRGFHKSRLRRMLQLRHLDPDDYLLLTSPGSRALHAAICRGCGYRRECDAALKLGGAADYGFCANGTMIERLLRDQAAL